MVYNYPYQQYSYPYYPQPIGQIQSPTPAPIPSNNLLILDTVSGRTAAEIYNVEMGKQAVLIDIDNPVIYKKSRGMDNKLEMLQYDLVLHEDEPKVESPKINLDDYIRKDAIEEIVDKKVQKEVERRLSEISFAPKTTRKKTVEE